MKVLVIGGSYFLGRVFVMQIAQKCEITLVNRGTYSMDAFGVRQLKADRKNTAFWQTVEGDYDAIIDFCAYECNDIKNVLENIKANVKQYIFISTVDVYARDRSGLKDENTPFEHRTLSGDAGRYISGKVSLEAELTQICTKKNINYTVLRPAILYGPYNYAPRESVYIQTLVQNHMLPVLTNATGKFQFLYVKDAAEAIIKCLLNEKTYGQAYNLCSSEIITYSVFTDFLAKIADVEFEKKQITVEEALHLQIPLPFPITDAESELYSNQKSINELDMIYTDFSIGMAKTYRAFKGVFLT